MAPRAILSRVLLATCLWLALGDPAQAANADNGRELYTSRCVFCHGAAGKGDGPAAAALKPSPTNFARTDYWKQARLDTIKGVIENGKPGTAMVAFKASFNAEQIDDLIAYLRTFNPQP